jgi:hypothetical protein
MKSRFKRLWFLLLLPVGLLGAVFYAWSFRPVMWQLKGATALELSEDGRVLVAQNGKLARVYDVRWKRVIGDISFSKGNWSNVVSTSEDGSRLVCVFGKQYRVVDRVEVFGIGTVSVHRVWSATIPATAQFLDARFVGRRLRVLYNDGITTFSPTGKTEGKIGFVGAPLFSESTAGKLSPDESLAVVGAQERVIVFDARSGQRIKGWTVEAYELWDFDFSRDGNTLTACSSHFLDSGYDPTVGPPVLGTRFYWSLPEGRLVRFLDDTGTLHSPFSPDGQAGLRESASRLWFENLRSEASAPAKFQIPLPFGTKKAWITDVRLSSNGDTIAALNEKGQIWLQR